jgi:hypothetical protein
MLILYYLVPVVAPVSVLFIGTIMEPKSRLAGFASLLAPLNVESDV